MSQVGLAVKCNRILSKLEQLMKKEAQCYLCEDIIQGHWVESVVNLPQLFTHVH